MGKLNQVVAVVAAKKKLATEAITNAYHAIQKPPLFDGITRVYTPRDEEGERLPPESKKPQNTVNDLIASVCPAIADMFDTVLTQDSANQEAICDVTVDGRVIAADVPVTHLLFLEKQLTDLTTFVSKLPVLDPADTWTWDDAANSFVSNPSETVRTKKAPKAFVKYEATKEHPAQVETFTEDVLVGTWRTVKFSGAIKAADKAAMLDRVRKLHEAVVKAREECNSMVVEEKRIGLPILMFVFKGA